MHGLVTQAGVGSCPAQQALLAAVLLEPSLDSMASAAGGVAVQSLVRHVAPPASVAAGLPARPPSAAAGVALESSGWGKARDTQLQVAVRQPCSL